VALQAVVVEFMFVTSKVAVSLKKIAGVVGLSFSDFCCLPACPCCTALGLCSLVDYDNCYWVNLFVS
jgi:hypothetical protein